MGHGARPLANLVGLNVVGMRRRGLAKADIHRVRAAYQALFFGDGEFRARIDVVAAEFASDPQVGKMIDFIRAGKRPLTMAVKRRAGRRGRMSAAAAQRTPSEGPLALICGGGTLPLAVADFVVRRGRQPVLFPFRGWADAGASQRYPHHWLVIGQLGRFFASPARPDAATSLFIGSLVRPSMWQVRLDWHDLDGCCRASLAAFRGGDDHLLSGVRQASRGTASGCSARTRWRRKSCCRKARSAACEASERDRADIAFGLDYLRATGPFDVGQAVVVAGKHVLAVEAAEGTDQMLARVAELRASGRVRAAVGSGVLVKAPKPGQDRRFDLPSIGPQTVEGVVRAGLAGIAVVAGATIVAEPERLVRGGRPRQYFRHRRAATERGR